MTLEPENEAQIRQFLLGNRRERSSVWDAERVEIVEMELIDQYLRGELSDLEREQFESYYLVQTGHRTRVDIARGFHRWVRRRDRSRLKLFRPIAVAASVMAVLLTYWNLSTLTLYPGTLRDPLSKVPTTSRALPRRIRLALIEPPAAGPARVVLLNGTTATAIWSTPLKIEQGAEYLTLLIPTWRLPSGSYRLEVQRPSDGTVRPVASYQIIID